MKELLYQEAENSMRMEPLLAQRNSNHATSSTTSSSSSAAASASAIMAASATTSTQMRATLIYLAPFLHPCKNVVVPGTQQQQQQQQLQHHQHQQQQHTTSSTALATTPSCSSMLSPSPCSGYERRNPDLNVGETLQKTHVALDTSSLSCTTSSSNSGSASASASSCGSGCNGPASTTGILRRGRVGTSNRNVMPSSTTMSGNSSRNNHNNNAINCNSTTNVSCDASRSRRHCSCCRNSLDGHDGGVGGGSGSETTTMSTTISSSCCHNNKNAAQHTKDNTQDKYYENYEMPALETTTSKTTTRTLYQGSNNKIRQETQDSAQEKIAEGLPGVVVDLKVENLSVSETKTDNPSLSLNTNTAKSSAKALTRSPCPKTHMMSFSNYNYNYNSSSSSSAFVNYTNNNRSTKYLRGRERERERGHRATTTQQQHHPQESQDHKYDVQQQQTRQRAYESSPTEETQRQQEQLQQQLPLKEFMQQRTTKSCGRGRPCGPLCDHHATGDTNIDNHHHQHQQQHQHQHQHQLHHHNHMTMKCYNNNNNQMANTSLLSRCHCINNMLSNAPDNTDTDTDTDNDNDNDKDKGDNPKDNKSIKAGHQQGANDVGHHNLILRNSSNECSSNRAENEYGIYFINTTTTSSPTSTPVSMTTTPVASPSSTTSSSSSSSPTTPVVTSSLFYPTKSSYTTILNKECRCFTTNKRDIIGSEIQENDAFSPDPPISSTTSPSPSPSSTSTSTSSASGLTAPPYTDDDSSYCLIRRSSSLASSALILPSPSTASLSLAPGWLPWLVVSLFGCSNKLTKAVTVSKWLFMWLLFIVLSSSAQCWAGRNDVPTNCTFPVRWEGSWFLSGYQQSIHIKGSQFSYRGRCAASDGNKYLIVDEKGCHRCLVIYEKHKNVLQYKESECEGDSMYMHQTNPSAMAMRSVLNQKPIGGNGGDHRGGAHPNLNGHSRLSSSDQYIMRSNDDMNDYFCKGRETLQNLCDQIPGDALLYSLFRESAEPVKCPLKGPFIFTYNRGNGECKSPVSNIESCTEDSRLLLSFQACPDVVGTESTVEELTCLATWKDGNSRYLVGLVSHHHAISNEERYRCFVYERTSALMDMGHFAGPSMSTSKDAEYKLAQSGDATCNGLDSAEVGSRIMSLRKPPVTERCDFPAWFKGPRHWHVLMGNAVYNYHSNDGSIHIIKPNGYMETRALCEQINKQTATEMMSVVHYTTGCQSGFMCMVFYRRDTHIIEIQTGKPASRLEDACAADHFDINKNPYITLLASNPDPQICPLEGLYTLRGAIGPPYMTTRHKRNHNNKVHGIHNHHHQYESNERGYLHRRHSSLSFRNSANPNEKNAWHSNTRGLPIRSRREASSTTTNPTALLQTNKTQEVQTESSSPSTPAHKEMTQQEILVVGNSTNVGFVQDPDDSDTRLRSRRNVPECITNYKAQRQLWIGCTEANVIDVRPLCNDEGDEEYSCHGSWSENGTVYIIARHKGTKHGVCISYRPTEGTNAKLVVGDACYRGTQKPPEHHLEANLSVFGKCGETGSTSATMPILSWLQLMIATLLITFLCQLPIQR